jgi:hypothetical protein
MAAFQHPSNKKHGHDNRYETSDNGETVPGHDVFMLATMKACGAIWARQR